MRHSVFLAGLSALALCGCQPTTPASAPVPPAPKATVSDFSKPLTALGTEPFWSVTIQGTELRLARPDQPDVTAVAPGATIKPGQAAWTGKTSDGQTLTVSVYVSPCSDGMSDRAYPMSAEVGFGRESWNGCAIKSAELKTPPQT